MLIIHTASSALPVFCPHCESEPMLRPEQIAELTGNSRRTIFHWIELGLVHFGEKPDGKLYVCANSLPRAPETIFPNKEQTHAN